MKIKSFLKRQPFLKNIYGKETPSSSRVKIELKKLDLPPKKTEGKIIVET